MKQLLLSLLIVIVNVMCIATAWALTKIEIDHYAISAPSPAVAQEKAKELAWSAKVFENLFGVAPPKGHVILRGNPNSGGAGGGLGSQGKSGVKWTLPWFAGAIPGMPAGLSGSGMNAMTHEAAHLQLIHLVNDGCSKKLKSSFNGYGSYLPDWVDETVAVYHEPDDMKAQRRTQLKTAVGNKKHIPFPRYFAMDHPLNGKNDGMPGGLQPPTGGGVGGGQLPPGALGGMSGEANTFYVQSLSVIEYLTDRAGKPFYRFCVYHLQKGRSMDEVLGLWYSNKKALKQLSKKAKKKKYRRKKSTRKGSLTVSRNAKLLEILRLGKGEWVKPLPKTIAGLEKDWLRWVNSKYPNYDAGLAEYP